MTCPARTHAKQEEPIFKLARNNHTQSTTMKMIPSLLLLSLLLVTPLWADEAKPNLNDPATLERILVEALDLDVMEKRGEEGEELFHAPDSQEPYTGWVKRMYKNGKINRLWQYKDGKLHGLETEWYENGQKRGEANYVDGKRHGLLTSWHENGQKRYETNYVDGKMHGLRTGWYEDGQKGRERNFKDGKRHGLETEWM